MKRFFVVCVLAIFISGCAYCGYTKISLSGKKLKKSFTGSISGDEVNMLMERSTEINKQCNCEVINGR